MNLNYKGKWKAPLIDNPAFSQNNYYVFINDNNDT